LTICLDTLGRELDATIVPVSGRTGEGIDRLRAAVGKLADEPITHELERERAQSMTERLACTACSSGPHTNRHTWACGVSAAAGIAEHDPGVAADPRTDKFDRILTQPVLGVAVFAAIMIALFALIFQVASIPMDWIDAGFSALGDAVAARLPEGLLASFLVDGLIAGVGGVVIF